MTRAARTVLLVGLAGAALASMVVAGVLVWGLPYEHVTLVIDGQRIDVPPLTAGHWLVASAIVLVVLVVLLVVVPLAIALGLALPLALFGLALSVAAAAAVVALSPLLLAGWLAWWLWRGSATRSRAAADRPPMPPEATLR